MKKKEKNMIRLEIEKVKLNKVLEYIKVEGNIASFEVRKSDRSTINPSILGAHVFHNNYGKCPYCSKGYKSEYWFKNHVETCSTQTLLKKLI